MTKYKIVEIDESYVYVRKYMWGKKQRFLYCPFSYDDMCKGKLKVGDKVKVTKCAEPNEGYFNISKTQ